MPWPRLCANATTAWTSSWVLMVDDVSGAVGDARGRSGWSGSDTYASSCATGSITKWLYRNVSVSHPLRSPLVTSQRRGAPAKAQPWDVLQINEVEVADTISTLREVGEGIAQQMTRLKDEQLVKTFLGGDEKQRLRAALRVTGAAVADLEYWSRVLVEFASRAGVPQREIATALGISTNTVNRWVREPLGWNRSDDTSSSDPVIAPARP